MKVVTSKDNQEFKALKRLVDDVKVQRSQRQTLIDGLHLFVTLVESGQKPLKILITEEALKCSEILEVLADHHDVPQLVLKESLFKEISGVATPTGLAAVIGIPEESALVQVTSCVLLDAVQDAGNVGAILRTAAAAGITDVYLGKGCASAWSPRVMRAAQGAHFFLRVREQCDLESLVATINVCTIATVAHGGSSLYALNLQEAVAWIFGNEGAGVSRQLVELANERTQIPLRGMESLNVAAAAAICIFEEVRQKSAAA